MLKHEDVWRAIDNLAADHGMSPSGLARRAGLDPTAFNKSKRISREGKPRWPSVESVAKVLAATGTDISDFARYVSGVAGGGAPPRRIPLIGFAQAGERGYFDDAGFPVGAGWDEIPSPEVPDPHSYALEVVGDSMEPVYRDGDTIIVSPAASIRRNDRVVVKTVDGEVMVKLLQRQSARRVELQSLNPEHSDRSLPVEQIAWMARIVWASQ
jgi:phage repressor protein C with HTH and peptisase S24 domain